MTRDMHAFLIMSRDISENLNILLRSIDYSNNNIFLHVDKKFQGNFDLLYRTSHAHLTIIPRIDANWAAYSLLQVELNLLESATNAQHFKYYHLLSEKDLPIKSNQEIHRFFKDKNSEFVDISSVNSKLAIRRIKLYYPLQEKLGKKHGIKWAVQKILMYLQIIFRVNRLRKWPKFCVGKGSQWFSITDDFARYILQKKVVLQRLFKNGQTVDELFIQTLLLNSGFKTRIGNSNLRFIKWGNKNSPEVLQGEKDFMDIEASGDLFARKFDFKVDNQIIEKIESEKEI